MPLDRPLTGGCLCGRVRFEVTEQPPGARYCHCTRCQRRTGAAASPAAAVREGSVRITRGEEDVRRWQPEDSGFAKAFCAECGSHLFAAERDGGPIRGVRMGAFDEDPGVRPSLRQFTADAAVWEPIPDDGLPRHPGRA